MKQTLLKGLICVATGTFLGACSDGIGTGFDSGSTQGTIALTTTVDCSLENSSSRAEYHEVTADDLSLRLTSADGSTTKTWDRVADFPTDQLFNVGTYTVEAFYGDANTEGFESPHFYGSATIKVEENVTTPVNIVANLANALLDIKYTDNFVNYMDEWEAEVHSAGGNYFVYENEETKPIYTKAGNVDVNISFTKPNGTQAKLNAASFTAEPRHFYHVTIDVSNAGNGNAMLNITFENGLEDVVYDIDISDDVLNAPAPEVVTVGFASGAEIELVGGNVPDERLGFDIIAYGGLKSATLTTQSASLLEQGWPAEINLVGGDLQPLENLGFESRGLKTPDKMAVITLNEVLSHINYINGADNNSKFTLVVGDKNGKLSETVDLTIVSTPINLGLSDGVYYVGDTYITFTLTYNGNDPAQDVKVEYQNTRGTWSALSPVYEETSKGVYTATAAIPATTATINLRANATNATGVEQATLAVTPTPIVFYDGKSYVNAFSNFAYIPVSIGNDSDTELLAQLMGNAKVYVSTDGNNFTVATTEADINNKTLKVTGLTPGAEYTFKILNPVKDLDHVTAYELATEETAQIENGNLDADVTTTNYGTNASLVQFPTWGTNNPMTSSQGANIGYCRNSGTLQTDDAHSGKAALLRTTGWGSGNTAGGAASIVKYFDAGLLHLGASRSERPDGYSNTNGSLETSDLDCGIAFESRPKSISFWYKYTPKNSSDAGQAFIALYDASGNAIYSETISLGAATAYTQKTVEPSYDHNTPKAAKLYIRFMSTADSSFFTKNSTNFSFPTFAIGSTPAIGSQLYIDDIVLNY